MKKFMKWGGIGQDVQKLDKNSSALHDAMAVVEGACV